MVPPPSDVPPEERAKTVAVPIADPEDQEGGDGRHGVPGTRMDPLPYRSDAETKFVPISDFSDEESSQGIEVSLSDMEPVADGDDDEPTEQLMTSATLVNASPLDQGQASDERAATVRQVLPPALEDDEIAALPDAAVVRRRSHNPASLFESEVEQTPVLAPTPARPAPERRGTATIASELHDEETAMPSEDSSESSDDEEVAEAPAQPPRRSSEAPPRLQEEEEDEEEEEEEEEDEEEEEEEEDEEDEEDEEEEDEEEEDVPVAAEPTHAGPSPLPSVANADPSMLSAEAPALHKWKVVPTVLREMDEAGTPRPAQHAPPNMELGRVRTVQTVLWSPEDDDKGAGEELTPHGGFSEDTDHGLLDEGEDSTTDGLRLSSTQRAAAYVHDAAAFLRSLSAFSAYLDEDVRADFDGRVLGAKEKLRRALAVMHVDEGEDEG
jgi:hypothetical protein